VSTVDLRTTIVATTPQQLFDLVRGVGGRAMNTEGNAHPDYSTALTDAQVWNIVKFMREEWVSPDELYRLAVDGPPVYTDGAGTVVAPTLTIYGIGVGGDATNGDAIYTASCAGCHGADGTAILLAGSSVGELVRAKPHEMWHKMKFGNIGNTSTEHMAPGIVVAPTDLLDLYSALTNATTYPDAL